MLLLPAHHLAGAIVIHLGGAEHWFLVARTERREAFQLVLQRLGDVLEVDDGIDVQESLGLLRHDMLLHVLLESLPELLHLVPSQRESGSIGVTTEVDEQVTATLDGGIHIKSRHASSRTRSHVAVSGEHDGRTEVDFRESGGDDADDTFLPSLVIEHDAGVVLLALQSRYDAVGFLGHLLVDVLALFVVFIDMFRHADGGREVSLHQEVNAELTILHTSRCVDARTYLEDDVAHRDLSSIESADVDDGAQAHARIGVELLQAMEGKDAVLVGHRHDVGSDAYGTEVEQWNESGERNVVVLGESLHELESHAASTEMLEWEGVVGSLRVEDSHSRWHHLVRNVVITDDEVYAKTLGIFYLLDGLDATVKDDDKFDTRLVRKVDSLLAHSISLVIAVGDVVVDVGIELLQELKDQSNGGAAIHIVVAIDQDALLASHRIIQAVNG